ncbi:MAG: hypothetical protein B7Z37_20185 [Verrucomicrobia bacterium 12-59-8]|jgi:hypothetical protein|nr:MAG: hypothetical protein B7Z37_20185 [Verrucomicrobia bacterium 12-59-8]
MKTAHLFTPQTKQRIMKSKLKLALVTLSAATHVTITLSSCESRALPSLLQTHNMGIGPDYSPMPNKNMPDHKH